MKPPIFRLFSILAAVLLWKATVQASDLTIPYNFEAGTPALASEVNENFTAVKDAVNARVEKSGGQLTGGLTVPALIYANPKSASITYAAVGFASARSYFTISGGFTFVMEMEFEKTTDGYTRSMETSGGRFYSAVTLPSGVTLTGLAAHVKAEGSWTAGIVVVRLQKRQLNSSVTTIAQMSTADDSQAAAEKIIETALAVEESITGDPGTFYFLEVSLDSNRVGFFSVTLEYEYSEP